MSYKFFSKIGIEPTFYPTTETPAVYDMTSKDRAGYYYYLNNAFTYFHSRNKLINNKLSKWVNKATTDDGVMEIPSYNEWRDIDTLMVEYKALVKYISSFHYIPSSTVNMDEEGGCHINVCLASQYKKKGPDYYERLAKNMVNFLNNYPSLVWLNLAPNDNNSSQIFLKEIDDSYTSTSKGSCLTFRRDKKCINYGLNDCRYYNHYTELRFFMMPQTYKEMEWNLILADKFIRFMVDQTDKRVEWKIKNRTHKSLENYTYETAKKEAIEALKMIGVAEIRAAYRFGKFDRMQERFDLGKKYLI